MLTIFTKTVIIYILLIITMRLMGKRQLGELEVTELVITILLSEIASTPITDGKTPMMHAIIPMATLAFLEITTSALSLKFPRIKKMLSSRPSVIISRGKIDLKVMRSVRISIEELICQVRQNGIFNLEEVDYAILEENGKMSIIPKNRYRQPDIKTLGLYDDDNGAMHIIISDGIIDKHNLAMLHKDRQWLDDTVKKYKLSIEDIFCMTCNDADKVFIIKKDGNAAYPI